MAIADTIRNLYFDYQSHKITSKYWIQFSVSLRILPLSEPIKTSSPTLIDNAIIHTPTKDHDAVAEITCSFTNKSLKPFHLYNLQVWLNAQRSSGKPDDNKMLFDPETGRYKLSRIFTSGNLLDGLKPTDSAPSKNRPYYYIGPQIQQDISFLCLLVKPKDLLQVGGKFSIEQERIFPDKETGKMKLLPHTATKTYRIDKNGALIL